MKSALIIIDGIGIAPNNPGNAVTSDTLPFLFQVMDQHGYAKLRADGLAVGLEEGQVGNSEVGHLTIGAGRVVPSMLRHIHESFLDGTWANHPLWDKLTAQPCLHIVGLLSDAGIHAHWRTMAQAAKLAAQKGIGEIIVHPILDGNDSAAGSAPELLEALQAALAEYPQIRFGLVMGRKGFCDRSGQYDLTQTFVNALCHSETHPTFCPEVLRDHLQNAPSEVTFPPHLYPGGRLCGEGEPVLHTSHRADRAAQAGQLINKIRPFFSMIELKDASTPDTLFFDTKPLDAGLVFICRQHGVNPVRIAEQCKFPHVTYFVNGFNPDLGEQSFCIPSIPDAEIPNQPKMSVEEVTEQILQAMDQEENSAIVANLANLDQVGHTGRVDLAIEAARSVNVALETIAAKAKEKGWSLVLTADHGNAEQMVTDEGKPLGSHTFNPVPLTVLPAPDLQVTWIANEGGLENIAASFLQTLAVPADKQMSPSLVTVE